MEHSGSTQLVKVVIPDAKTEKCIVLDMAGTVWAAKQMILDKVYRELPDSKDPLNYSLYLPASGTGKLGKFMDDCYQLSNYVLHGNLPKVEMRYKSRDYTKQVSLTEKAISKANSKANQRKLVDHVTASAHRKIDKLLDAGLDPNFLMDDGNTPLGLSCGRGRSVQCIQALLSGGAHIDFRGKDGLTPLHRAAIGGNALAINSLLSYGASPDYRDAKGLTPLYHTAIMGDDPGACITLLRYRAEIGVKDQGGWSELHHTSKYGHIQHAELFIRYGADINDQNLVGNTPLHVAASHGQIEYALMLLRRGSDRTKTNFSGQTPSQVAILCGHHKLAKIITEFPTDKVEPIKLLPEYNESARQDAPRLYSKSSEASPTQPSVETMVDILVKEREEERAPEESNPQLLKVKASTGRPGSASSHSSSPRPPADTDSISSFDNASIHSDSTGPPGTPGLSAPSSRKMSFTSLRERLYRAGPGKYRASQDVEPQQHGDIALKKGMIVEVTYIGKGGYWEGRAGGAEGWFPRLAIKEIGEEQYDFQTENDTPSTPATSSVPKTTSTPSKSSTSKSSSSGIREVNIYRGNRSYGFAMRGVRATTAMKFQATPEVPALQYVGNVEENGAAAEAGLVTGDFIIEVEGVNVTHSTHDEVVKIIRKAGDMLRMKVITPLIKPKSVSQQYKKQITPVNTPESSRREFPILEETPPTKLENTTDRETVIGEEATLSRTDSPMMADNEPTGWDSSQDDDPAISRDHSSNPTLSTKVPFSLKSYSRESPARPPLKDLRSQTLPVIPAKDYPRLEDYANGSSADEDEVEGEGEGETLSAFELALRQNKQKINRKSNTVTKERSSTLPERGSPLMIKRTAEENGQSSMSQQILQASKARMERMDNNQLRMSPHSSPGPLRDNPIAKSLSSKIEVAVVDSDDADSETEGSYSPSQFQLKPTKKSPPVLIKKATPEPAKKAPPPLTKKAPPPATKPKPLKKAPSSPGTSWRSKIMATQSSPLLETKQAHSIDTQSPPTKTQYPLPKPVSAKDCLNFDLPPPLPLDEKRPPLFVDVAPPVGFSLDKASDGEDKASDGEDIADFVIPPPLPQSSPPPAKPSQGAEVFVFPDSSPQPPSSPVRASSPQRIPKSQSTDMLPSPMPSPPSADDVFDLSNSVVPPPEFVNTSPRSPEADDTPPPLPSASPPPLELDEQNDFTGSQIDDFFNSLSEEIDLVSKAADVPVLIDEPPPPANVPTPSSTPEFSKDTTIESPESSVAPEVTPKPLTGFSPKEQQPVADDQTATQPVEVKVQSSTQDANATYSSKPVEEWEVEDVCEWLKEIGLGEYAESFEENEIVGEILKDLSKDDLKDLGIKKIGHQKKLNLKLAALLT